MTAAPLDCPKQARCPGCPLGAAPYEQGLVSKGQELAVALSAYPVLHPALLPPRAAITTSEYRLRAKLVIKGKALGLFERGSHRVLDVTGCKVLSPALTRATAALRRLLPLPLYGADLRETSEGVLLTLLTEAPGARSELTTVARGLVERGEALSVALSTRRAGDVRLLASPPEVLVGPTEARHALSAAAPYGYAAHGGFVQAHAGQASYVYTAIARGIRERLPDVTTPSVLELFAGNGTLALTLARGGAQVTAVEAYAPAIGLAERAAREQGLALRAVASDATAFAKGAGARFDAIVVNPPRRGLDPDLRRSVAQMAPRAFAYVSCNPHTLARDAQHFAIMGLRLRSAEPLDMIPWSDAVEVLAWFEPASAPAPAVLLEDAQCLAVAKEPHETAAALGARVRQLPGCESAVALGSLGDGASGVVWLAKGDADAASLQLGEQELCVLVRGNLRKQGTIARAGGVGTRYKRRADAGRHALTDVLTLDGDERGVLADFAQIRFPILGDARCDAASNDYVQHRHGLERPFVHVARSQLRTPSGAVLTASAELAPDLARVLSSLQSD